MRGACSPIFAMSITAKREFAGLLLPLLARTWLLQRRSKKLAHGKSLILLWLW